MVVQTHRLTADEFERFVELPANADKRLEYIAGEVCVLVSNNYSSLVAANILFFIKLYLRESGTQGYVTGADGGYIVAGDRYMPDVAFVSKAKQPEPSHETWNPNAPDLAVEVLSPTDAPDEVRIKVITYLSAGTIVWLVNPEKKRVEVYTPGPQVDTAEQDETLDGGAILPGFKLAVKDIFPEEQKADTV
jgi:Uma2 family endonuclease